MRHPLTACFLTLGILAIASPQGSAATKYDRPGKTGTWWGTFSPPPVKAPLREYPVIPGFLVNEISPPNPEVTYRGRVVGFENRFPGGAGAVMADCRANVAIENDTQSFIAVASAPLREGRVNDNLEPLLHWGAVACKFLEAAYRWGQPVTLSGIIETWGNRFTSRVVLLKSATTEIAASEGTLDVPPMPCTPQSCSGQGTVTEISFPVPGSHILCSVDFSVPSAGGASLMALPATFAQTYVQQEKSVQEIKGLEEFDGYRLLAARADACRTLFEAFAAQKPITFVGEGGNPTWIRLKTVGDGVMPAAPIIPAADIKANPEAEILY